MKLGPHYPFMLCLHIYMFPPSTQVEYHNRPSNEIQPVLRALADTYTEEFPLPCIQVSWRCMYGYRRDSRLAKGLKGPL